MSKKARTLVLIAALATASAPKGSAKDRDWQEGKLVSPTYNRYVKGLAFADDSKVKDLAKTSDQSVSFNTSRAPDQTVDHYGVETSDRLYVVERVRFKSSGPASDPGQPREICR